MTSAAKTLNFSRPEQTIPVQDTDGVRVLFSGHIESANRGGVCMLREIAGKGIRFDSRLRLDQGCSAIISLRGNRLAEGHIGYDSHGRAWLHWEAIPAWAHAILMSGTSRA